MRQSTEIEVLAIAGAPRSGSTVIAQHLANQTRAVHVGELHLLFDRLSDRSRLCGCGKSVATCGFWSPVWSRVVESGVVADLAEALHLKQRAIRLRDLANQDRTAQHHFAELMASVYGEVARESGSARIIDSSKHPQYFDVVGQAVDLRLLHLVRDPRAVAYSWSVPKGDPDSNGGAMRTRHPVTVSAEWILLNVLSSRLSATAPWFHRARLEDLVNGSFDSLAETLGLPVERADEESAQVVHTVAGNPLRHGDLAPLRADHRWRDEMRASDRLIVSAITFPFAKFFGYSVRYEQPDDAT